MSKQQRKGNPSKLCKLSLYTIHLPHSNHISCFNIPSQSPLMILNTNNSTLIYILTPYHPASQYICPYVCCTTVFHHPPRFIPYYSCHKSKSLLFQNIKSSVAFCKCPRLLILCLITSPHMTIIIRMDIGSLYIQI